MAKKLGKFLLGAAIIGGAAAATYIYLQKKGVVNLTPENADEDYDDFSDETVECPVRNYVSLTNDTEECVAEETVSEEPVFTEGNPEEAVVNSEETTEPEAVEEFFNEEKTEA